MAKITIKACTLFAIITIAVAGCMSDGGHSTTESPSHLDTHSAITYTIGWGWGNAKADQTGGWHVTNNLGYAIHITEGKIVNASLQLVPCAKAAGWLAPNIAHAGHGGGQPDSTRWGGPLIESLSALRTVDLGAVDIGDHRYCQAHYLLAQDERKNGSGIVDVNPTIALTGTYVLPTGGAPIPFNIATNIAWGSTTDLPKDMVIDGTTRQTPRGLTLIRDLGTLLDGVDFVVMTPDQQARAVLRSLTTHIHVVQHP